MKNHIQIFKNNLAANQTQLMVRTLGWTNKRK